MQRPFLTKTLTTLALAVLCLFSTTVMAQPPSEVTSVEGITEYRLNNGVKLLLFPDDSKPQFLSLIHI